MNVQISNIGALIRDERITAYLMEDNDMDMPAAIVLFHNSETFEKLSDETTGLYIERPSYVYEILKSEIKMGKIG